MLRWDARRCTGGGGWSISTIGDTGALDAPQGGSRPGSADEDSAAGVADEGCRGDDERRGSSAVTAPPDSTRIGGGSATGKRAAGMATTPPSLADFPRSLSSPRFPLCECPVRIP